jgi:hypothetical protein
MGTLLFMLVTGEVVESYDLPDEQLSEDLEAFVENRVPFAGAWIQPNDGIAIRRDAVVKVEARGERGKMH